MHVWDIDRIMIAVPNIDDATEQFERQLGLAFGDPVGSSIELPTGVQRSDVAYSHPGVEFVSPRENNEVARFLDEYGPGLFGLVFRVRDLDAAETHLADQGIDPIASDNPGGARERHYHPNDFNGTYVILTEYDHPGFTP